MSDAKRAMARPIQSPQPVPVGASRVLRARPAQPGDGVALAIKLRDDDIRELIAGGVAGPYFDLEEACAPGRFTVAGVNEWDYPQLLFGTDSQISFQTWGPSIAVWMLAAEGIERYALQLARQSRPYVQSLLRAHGPGVAGHNMVDARNALHIRWLKWCGAVFTGNEYFPTDTALPFLEFYIPQCANPYISPQA